MGCGDERPRGGKRRSRETKAVQVRWEIALLAAWIVLAGAVGVARAAGRSTQSAQNAQDSRAAGREQATPAPDARVDINHATVDELMRVPGMTETWAGRIVRFRPYRTKQDLVDKGVVTSQVYDRIKDYVIAHQVAGRKKQ
jgi:competence protein ComEA